MAFSEDLSDFWFFKFVGVCMALAFGLVTGNCSYGNNQPDRADPINLRGHALAASRGRPDAISIRRVFSADGITTALTKLNERLDFLEATVFGWTLPVHQKQTPEYFEEPRNPWAEALARHRKVAGQSLSGSTVYDSSYASGSASSSKFPFDLDTFPRDWHNDM
ncbi:hypothetical protein B0H14DRAFT_3143855 [Mycena olivaceomarginata]|nr:hypothetical protein B0H14DRAFT_3143855 [Mycena olivaceomarginata]